MKASKLKHLFILFLCAPGVFPPVAYGQTETLKLGGHTFEISRKMADGKTPIIPLWEAQMPTSNQLKAVGFPILKEARHFDVWKPAEQSEGAYNHYACLIFHKGRFYAMWGNHPYGENCPGQRVLFTSSTDGRSWEPPAVLFPQPCFVLSKGAKGMYLVPDRWVEVDGKLYAVTYVMGSGTNTYPIACEVADNGVRFGEPVLLRELPEDVQVPQFMSEALPDPELGAKIGQWYEDNGAISWFAYNDTNSMISWWAQDGKGISSTGLDKARLLEFFSFRSDKGVVAFARDYSSHTSAIDRKSSNRLYVSFVNSKGVWSTMRPTNIPDSHSRAQALRLSDGRVLLAGNQIAHQFDKSLYLVRDPLTLAVSPNGETFTKVFALRSGGRTQPKHRFSGISGSTPAGYGYPSMVVHDGMLYVLYSVNKEDMAITIVPLSALE